MPCCTDLVTAPVFGLGVGSGRARQTEGIVSRFRSEELCAALIAIYEADKRLWIAVPDARVAVELLVMKLTRTGYVLRASRSRLDLKVLS